MSLHKRQHKLCRVWQNLILTKGYTRGTLQQTLIIEEDVTPN